MKKTLLYPLFVICAAAIDIWSKFLILDKLQPGGPVNVLGDVLKFNLVMNDGLVFGMSAGNAPPIMIVITKTVIIAFIVYLYLKIPKYFIKKGQTFTQFALLFIVCGYIGNTFDRLYHGAVVDFIDIGFGNLRWYIFNLADVYVVTGGLMVLLAMFLYSTDKQQNK